MPDRYRVPSAADTWTAARWKAAYDKAAAFLATGEKWVVGPAVVRMYWNGWQRALEAERRAG